MRLPQLSPTAKGQLWGLLVGGGTAFLLIRRTDLSLALFLVGWAAAWALGEKLFGHRLVHQSDRNAIILAVVSGLAFPWVGVLFAWGLQLLRP